VERSTLRRLHRRARKKREHRNEKRRGRKERRFVRARAEETFLFLASVFFLYERTVRLRLCSLYLILIILLSCELTRVRARARASARARFPSRGGSEKEKVSFSIHPERVISPLVKVSRGKIKISRFDFKWC